MKRLLSLALLSLPFVACAPSDPTELVPTFDSLVGLPGLAPESACTGDDCCLAAGWCLDVETLSVRNVGSRTVTISSAELAAHDDDPDGVDAFSDLVISALEVAPNEQASLRFRYTTPGGDAQKAKIVIVSDAEVNPTLEVVVQTDAYTPPGEQDAGQSDAG